MLYTLVATTRISSKNIEIITSSDLQLINLITNYFKASSNILRFTVLSIDENQNKSIVYIKELEPDYLKEYHSIELRDDRHEKRI